MAKAIWNGVVIAESEHTQLVEGNHYFPVATVNQEFLRESEHHTICPWKGEASYYHVVVDGKESKNAAWYYPTPKPAAKQIKDHIAFWRGVQVKS